METYRYIKEISTLKIPGIIPCLLCFYSISAVLLADIAGKTMICKVVFTEWYKQAQSPAIKW